MSDVSGEPPRPPRGDPGWPAPALRSVLIVVAPWLLHRTEHDETVPVIVTLRRNFLGFVVVDLMILLVLSFAVSLTFTTLDDPRAWGLVVLGTLTSIGGPDAVRRRRILCATPASIARQVSAVLYLGISTTQSAALLGFVAAFVVGEAWPYLLASVPTALGLLRTAPTRRRIEELDRRLEAVGCDLTVSQVVYAHPGDPSSPTEGTAT